MLLHYKKSGCDLWDILVAAGITPGHIEIDGLAQQNAGRERIEQRVKQLLFRLTADAPPQSMAMA